MDDTKVSRRKFLYTFAGVSSASLLALVAIWPRKHPVYGPTPDDPMYSYRPIPMKLYYKAGKTDYKLLNNLNTEVPVRAVFKAVFSVEMNTNTNAIPIIDMTSGSSKTVNVTKWLDANTLIIQPSSRLEPNSLYQLMISHVVYASGNDGSMEPSPFALSFTTAGQ